MKHQQALKKLKQLQTLWARRAPEAQRQLLLQHGRCNNAEKELSALEAQLNEQRATSSRRERAFLERLRRAPMTRRDLEQARCVEAAHSRRWQTLIQDRAAAVDVRDQQQRRLARLT